MKHNAKMIGRIMLWLVILSLMIACHVTALAETKGDEDKYTSREFDALVDAFVNEADGSFYSMEWDNGFWYKSWLKAYGLEGEYGYGFLESDLTMKTERIYCDIALEYWMEECGITSENDLSLASELYPLHHRLNGQIRDLVLIIRVHENKKMDFYVLLDGKTKEILAASDPQAYMLQLEQIKAQQSAASRIATDAVVRKYGDQFGWLNEDYLNTALIIASGPYQTQQTEMVIREVLIYPENEYIEEFRIWIDEKMEKVLKVQWYPDSYCRYSADQFDRAMNALEMLEDAYLSLIQAYGEDYKIPITEKAAFYDRCKALLDEENQWDYLGYSPVLSSGLTASSPQLAGMSLSDIAFLLPEQADMTKAQAGEITEKALMQYYQLTEDQAKSLTYYASFHQNLFTGKKYWDFRMDIGNIGLFMATVDADEGILVSVARVNDQNDRNMNLILGLEKRYGDWGEWPISIKAAFAHIYLDDDHDYGMPGEGQIQEEEALTIAKDALIHAYPELTMEQLNRARIWPYFCVKPHMLYGVMYDPPVYYFSFDVDWNYSCYEVILDGETGEIYLLHDPSTSGNG